MEKVNELDWNKLVIAEKDLQIAKLKLELLKKELVIAYRIENNDKITPEGQIIRGNTSEPTEDKLA